MMIGAALLGIVAIALVVAALRWARRDDHAPEVRADSAQVEREVYEQLYGKSSAALSQTRPVERPPDAQTDRRLGQRPRADRTDPRSGHAPGPRVTGHSVPRPMQQT